MVPPPQAAEQLSQRKRRREQYSLDRDRIKFGTQGAASEVRKIDVASVDAAALLEQLERQGHSPSTGRTGWPVPRARFFLRKGKVGLTK
jgi:hypothetical protein